MELSCPIDVVKHTQDLHPASVFWRSYALSASPMQATKAVKGTLNKLTPEKFERLLQQLVDVVTSAEILHTTISLVFESAVAQPTFVAMYADLCDRLSKVGWSTAHSYPCHCKDPSDNKGSRAP